MKDYTIQLQTSKGEISSSFTCEQQDIDARISHIIYENGLNSSNIEGGILYEGIGGNMIILREFTTVRQNLSAPEALIPEWQAK